MAITPKQSRSALDCPKIITHFGYIDAVRGLAFLGVLAIHCAASVGRFPLRWIFLNGEYGVQLFFLASAITLCSSYRTRSQIDTSPVSSFYLRRLFRIAPLFWLAIVLYWTFPAVMPSFWLGQWAPARGLQSSDFVLTALFLHGWHPYTFNSIVPGGWSIAVEMSFYAVFPYIFTRLFTLRRAAIATLAGIVLELLSARWLLPAIHHKVYADVPDNLWSFFAANWFPAQAVVFLIGIFLFHFGRAESTADLRRRREFIWCVLVVSAAICLRVFAFGAGRFPAYLPVVAALAGLVVAMSGGFLPLLINSATRYLGKISYSCYLVHFAVLGIVLHSLGFNLTRTHPLIDTGSYWGNAGIFAALFGLTLALTVVFSTLTFHVVESPGIELGRRVVALANSPERYVGTTRQAAQAGAGAGLK